MAFPIPQHVCMLCGMAFQTSNLLRKHEIGGLCVYEEDDRNIRTASTDLEPYESRNWDRSRGKQTRSRQDVFKELQEQRQHLMRRKEDIDHQLDSLRQSGYTPSSKDVLTQIQEKEEQNSQLINNTRLQLNNLQKKFSQLQGSEPSILSEINEIRQRYLRQGGGNPEILSHLARMEAEAYEVRGQNRKSPNKQNHSALADKLLDLELENQKLKNELTTMIEHRDERFAIHQANRERGNYERQLLRRQIDNEQRLKSLQYEVDKLIQQLNYQPTVQQTPQTYSQAQFYKAEPLYKEPTPQPKEVQPLSARTPDEILYDLSSAPYDPVGGFSVFFDFISSFVPSVTSCRLLTTLHKFGTSPGDPQILPDILVYPHFKQKTHAMLSLRQPVPNLLPSIEIGLLIQLQVIHNQSQSMVTVAWTRVNLFDQHNRLISGYWKIPLRLAPLQANTPSHMLNNISQYGETQLYFRLVNNRDISSQLLYDVDANKECMYKYMPQIQMTSTHIPPPPTGSPPPVLPLRSANRQQKRTINLGIQIDRVKYVEQGEAKVRVTVYERYTGKVAQSRYSAITCSTGIVDSSFRYNYHMFGLQEATFADVNMDTDMILVARLYLILRGDGKHVSDENLVAWAALPLILPDDIQGRRCNTGSKTLTLFEPPVPSVSQVLINTNEARSSRMIYRDKATVKMNIFTDDNSPESPTPSLPSEDEEEFDPIGSAWIPSNRHTLPIEPYFQQQGFDLYIDCCRFLPDAVTITKVAGRLLNRNYEKFGKDINAVTILETDAFNPSYNFRMEFRQPNLPPTATLLLKVYTIDKFNKQLTVVGYATLNVFVESGTEKQPLSDTSGIQISLNEGGHQLRLYHHGPKGNDPFAENVLRTAGVRIVPCASLLVRIVKAPVGPKGKSLEANKVPRKDWDRLGLDVPRPNYEFGGYYTTKCQPTSSERQLFPAMLRRNRVALEDVLPLIAREKDSKMLMSEKGRTNFIQKMLEKSLDQVPVELDLAYITTYQPKSGIMAAVDAAQNLPWSGFTYGVVFMNPPASFYQGPPQGSFDKPVFLQKLDMNSLNKTPSWKDGFVRFKNRAYIKHLTFIIHLQEIQVSIEKDSYVYQLMDQAWTAVQVFTKDYAECSYFQLPLFSGSPTRRHLEELSLAPCRTWIKRNVETGLVTPADNASVMIRLTDGRRDTELPSYNIHKENVNTEYLNLVPGMDYRVQQGGHPLLQDIPDAKDPQTFPSQLANQFKTLIYKVYEEGNLGSQSKKTTNTRR